MKKFILLFLLMVPLAMAANDPGHDSLYVLLTGDSNVVGNINITENLTASNLQFAKLLYGNQIDIRANGSIFTVSSRPAIQSDSSDLYLDSTSDIYLATKGGTTGVIQIGPTTGSSITLNVSGTIRQQNVAVCLQDGTNCPTGGEGGTGNVTSSQTSTDNAIVRWDGTTGAVVQNSVATLSDTGVGAFATGTTVNSQLLCLADGTNCPAGSSDQDLWENVTSDSGSVLANSATDVLTITGGGSLDTSISGDSLTIDVTDDTIDGTELSDTITLDANLIIDNLNVTFDSDSNTLFVDAESNNVGIGTSSPGNKLSVITSVDGGSGITVQNTFNGSSSRGSVAIKNEKTTGTLALLSFAENYSNSVWANKGWVSSGVGLDGLILGTQNVERMIIDNSGNVGIGLMTPVNELEVNGTINATDINIGTTNLCREDGTDCPAFGTGSMSSFTVAGDSGSDQNITEGNTITFDGRNSIATVGAATDTIQIDVVDDSIDGTELANTITLDGNLNIAGTSGTDFHINNTNLVVDFSTNRIGILDASPTQTLSIVGNIGISDTEVISSSRVGSFANSTTVGGLGVCLADGTNCLSSGTFNSFTVAGDSGSDQNITEGNVLTFDGVNSIATVGAATDTIQIDVVDDSIDGSELADTLTLDAQLTINSNNVSIDSGIFFFDITNNNLGVGTGFPDALIDVAGSNIGIQLNETDGTAYELRASVNQFRILDLTNGVTPFKIGPAAGDNILVINNSKVGIGLLDPTNELEVQGTINATDINIGTTNLCREDGTDCPAGASDQNLFETVDWGGNALVADSATDTVSITAGNAITLTGSTATDSGTIAVTDDGIDGAQLADTLTLDANLIVSGTSSTDVRINNTFFVDFSASNVGIGDATPTATLDVTGNIGISDVEVISSSSVGTFANSTTVGGLGVCLADGTNCPGTGNISGHGVANRMAIWTDDSNLEPSTVVSDDGNFSVDTNVFFVDTVNRRIGFGTASPSATYDMHATSPNLELNETDQNQAFRIAVGAGIFGISDQNTANAIVRIHPGGLGSTLIINDTGKIGIRVAVPEYGLDVLSDGRFQSTSNPGLLVGDGSTGYIQVGGSTISDAAGDLTLDSDSGEVYIPDELGIGTADPAIDLHVVDATGEANSASVRIENGTGTERNQFNIVPNVGDGGFSGLSQAGDVGIVVSNTSQDGSTGLVLAGWNSLSGGIRIGALGNVSMSNVMYVDNENDRIGIGTSIPSYQLAIEGVSASISINDTNGNAIVKGFGHNGPADRELFSMEGFWNGTEIGSIQFRSGDDTTNHDDGEIVFVVGESGVLSEAMRIDQKGYVGIRTQNVSTELTIAGEINLTDTGDCIHMPGGGTLCGNTTCITLTSPDGGTKVESCN